MLINILAWLFGPTKKSRRRSRSDNSLNDLLGSLLLVVLVLGLWL